MSRFDFLNTKVWTC